MSDQDTMKTIAEAVEVKIAKLELEPGDYLIVQMPPEMSAKMDPIAKVLKRMMPKDVRVIVMSDEWDLTVISRKQLEETHAEQQGG